MKMVNQRSNSNGIHSHSKSVLLCSALSRRKFTFASDEESDGSTIGVVQDGRE